MNLFTNAWIYPRKTTRYIIEHKSLGYTLLFFWLTLLGVSFTSYHAKAKMAELFEPITFIQFIIMYVVIIPFVIMAFLAIAALITMWVGRLFKGTGTYIDVLKAVAVGHIPLMLPIPFMLAWLIVDTNGFLTSSASLASDVSMFVAGLSTIWAFYITIGTVSEAHRFSYGQSVMTLLIPAALLMGFLFIIIFTLSTFIIS